MELFGRGFRVRGMTWTFLPRHAAYLVGFAGLVGVGGIGCGSPAPSAASTADAGGAADAEASTVDAREAPDSPSEAATNDAGAVVTIPLAGCAAGFYTLPVAVSGSGTFQLIFDTGSATMGVASSACAECADAGVSPLYQPLPPAVDQHQPISSGFDGSSWSGELYEDAVTVGPTKATMAFVAIDMQNQFFFPFSCGATSVGFQGVLGFARPGAAIPGTTEYFDRLVATQGVPDVFAAQLCDDGGTLWLGGYDPAFVTSAPQYVPMSTSGIVGKQFYGLDFEQVTVGGVASNVPTGGYQDSVIDTGNNAFYLPSAAFSSVTSTLFDDAAFKSLLGAQATPDWFTFSSNCATLTQTKAELDAMLPSMTLVFGTGASSVTIKALPSESYLVPNGAGVWCPGVFEWTPSQGFPFASIIGSPVLRSSVVVFDRANERVGFAPHQPCPTK
jgi:hypothetical protein